jgi:hypothetical protein
MKRFLDLGDNKIPYLQNYISTNRSLDSLAQLFMKVAIDYEAPPVGDDDLSSYCDAVHEFIGKYIPCLVTQHFAK